MVLPVEAAGALGDGGVELVEMVRGADHADAVVGFEAVYLVEEVSADFVGDEGIEVFEDEDTRRHCARAGEDLADAFFWAVIAVIEILNIEAGDLALACLEGVDQGFDAEGLPVAGGAVKDDAALPGDVEGGVHFLRVEEGGDVVDDSVFQGGGENHIRPLRAYDAEVEFSVFAPGGVVEDVDLAVHVCAPFSYGHEQFVDSFLCCFGGGGDSFGGGLGGGTEWPFATEEVDDGLFRAICTGVILYVVIEILVPFPQILPKPNSDLILQLAVGVFLLISLRRRLVHPADIMVVAVYGRSRRQPIFHIA